MAKHEDPTTVMSSRADLAAECHELRIQLKEWERAFAEANSGRKPTKGDIKKDADVVGKYKVYNRKRDVLDGKEEKRRSKKKEEEEEEDKKDPAVRELPSPAPGDVGPRVTRRDIFATPQKVRHGLPETHPSVLDPYDIPQSSGSPHGYVFRNAIGPTPQRDGQLLGLFDCLSTSASTPSSSAAGRKRKASAVEEQHASAIGMVQTPSRKAAKGEANLGIDQSVGSSGFGRRHSRTPASEGKRFLLSQFFATPSAVRFATGTESQLSLAAKYGCDQTPLRNKVLGKRAGNHAGPEDYLDTTPAFLKRTTSFNQRLLGASGAKLQSASSNSNLQSTTDSPAVRKIPSFRPIKGKPLSEILRSLRRIEDEENDEDGLDALREMEGNETNVLIGNSQAIDEPPQVDENPERREWKKKGQKRTTRRVMMRPVMARRKAEKAKKSEEESDSDQVDDDAYPVDGDSAKVVETQPTGSWKRSVDLHDEEENDDLVPFADGEDAAKLRIRDVPTPREISAHDDKVIKPPSSLSSTDSETDELSTTSAAAALNGKPFKRRKHYDASDGPNEVPHRKPSTKSEEQKQEPSGQEKKAKKTEERDGKNKEKVKKSEKKQQMKKQKGINPNATSNLNFRSLKIRNRNSSSKAGHGGRQRRFEKGRR